jgi:hypothetical protein
MTLAAGTGRQRLPLDSDRWEVTGTLRDQGGYGSIGIAPGKAAGNDACACRRSMGRLYS